MTPFDALVAQIGAKRDHYEDIIRAALRKAAMDDPALLTDDWGGTSAVDEFVEMHLYDLEGLPLDGDPGLKWSYGQMFAADELQRFAETLQPDGAPMTSAPSPSPASPPAAPPSSPAPTINQTPTPPVTAESARSAAASGGAICPACGAGDAVETDVDEVEGTWYQRKVCGACGAGWTNVWEFARLLVFGPSGDPDVYEREPEPRGAGETHD